MCYNVTSIGNSDFIFNGAIINGNSWYWELSFKVDIDVYVDINVTICSYFRSTLFCGSGYLV